MMLVVAALTTLGLYIAQRHVAEEAENQLQREFSAALERIESARATRTAALAERCALLVRRARIHAAIEDDALDLLYPNARDELQDLMAPTGTGLHAKFYRFLDQRGALIPGSNVRDIGPLTAEEAARLVLPRAPAAPQSGYLPRATPEGDAFDHFITTPILSMTTGQPIAALAVGFAAPLNTAENAPALLNGIWSDGRFQIAGLAAEARDALARALPAMLAAREAEGDARPVDLAGAPHLVIFQRLNLGSAYPPAYEVCAFPLAATLARQRELRWQIIGLGLVLLIVGLAASQTAAVGLARPVEQLAATSRQTEVKLELTQAELQRAARFSSDASHQLKTPVAVLRASLDELLARDDLTEPVRAELCELVNQTSRFKGMIEDLLLLSRMDAGRLQIEFAPVNLAHLVASWLDDLSILPEATDLEITTDVPEGLCVSGERRYVSLILQNLLENARKYNRPGGRIRVAARAAGDSVVLAIGNTGAGIAPEARAHIFERFHRGSAAEDVPGHGLGLNLARELARLHGGEVRLAGSAPDWTEFEVSFRLAKVTPVSLPVAR